MCGRCDCCDEHALDCQCANKYNFNMIYRGQSYDQMLQGAVFSALDEIKDFALNMTAEKLGECVKFHIPMFSRRCLERPMLLSDGRPPCTAPKMLEVEVRCSVR